MLNFSDEVLAKYEDEKPAYQRVYLILKEMISLRNIGVTEKLTEEGVAKALKISRTPVRTALIKLQEEGYLQKISRNTLGIKEFSRREINNRIDLALALEPAASSLAAKRNLSSEDKMALSQLNKSLLDLAEQRLSFGLNQEPLRDLSLQLHLLIAKFSGNPFLYKMIVENRNSLRIISNPSVNNSFGDYTVPVFSNIIKAIENHDPEKAAIWTRCLIEQSRSIYCEKCIR